MDPRRRECCIHWHACRRRAPFAAIRLPKLGLRRLAGIEEPVFIEWTPRHFGGARRWFACPGIMRGVACRRRVGKLYDAGRYSFAGTAIASPMRASARTVGASTQAGKTSSDGGLDASPVGIPTSDPAKGQVAADL
jgi:hypothetical protein